MESADTVVVGIVLLLIFPLLFVEAPAYMRAGYKSDFWKLPRDEKLDHIATQPGYWTRMGVVWLPILTLSVAGLTAFSHQLASVEAGTLAYLALGAFGFGAVAWMIGSLVQTSAVRRAAELRAAEGTTPGWLDAAWNLAWWAELTYIVAANLAFVAWGIAILDAGFPAMWMGWTAIIGGVIALMLVAFARQAFPQLGVLVPIALGVALVLY
jgi:hypothetical protein